MHALSSPYKDNSECEFFMQNMVFKHETTLSEVKYNLKCIQVLKSDLFRIKLSYKTRHKIDKY